MSQYTVHSLLDGSDQMLSAALVEKDWGKVEIAKEQLEDALTRIEQIMDVATKLFNEGGYDL